ncbi:MAG: 4Fe-4S dicluster domain-containing protein [Desulfobacterales bacterium]|nr:4Fe-4S dicluster domain-containing protein [Desulfobacterales bacterium]
MSYFQVNDKCNGCLACVQNCPANALKSVEESEKRTLLHNMARCARCGNCWRVCPREAIEFQHILKNEWDEVITLDLLLCEVCGEPIYTPEFGETLSEKLDEKVQTLCPRHKEALSLLARAHFPGEEKQAGKRQI